MSKGKGGKWGKYVVKSKEKEKEKKDNKKSVETRVTSNEQIEAIIRIKKLNEKKYGKGKI